TRTTPKQVSPPNAGLLPWVARTITVVKMGAPFLGDFYVIFFIDAFLAALYSRAHELRFALDNSPFRSLCGRNFLCGRSCCASSGVDCTRRLIVVGGAVGLFGGSPALHVGKATAHFCSVVT